MNAIELGKFIASLRNEKGLTQEELAEKLFIDKRKVSRWECGTSIPEFELLIKLSEILDVSLYELSICKRVDKIKFNKRLINKFKTIKDLKHYKIKKILIAILILLISIFSLFTIIYTLRNSGTVKIYKILSLDEQYRLDGTFAIINEKYYFNIDNIQYIINGDNSKHYYINNCNYEIYNKRLERIIHIINNDESLKKTNKLNSYKVISPNINNYIKSSDYFKLKINCNDDDINEIIIDFLMKEQYNNSIFNYFL